MKISHRGTKKNKKGIINQKYCVTIKTSFHPTFRYSEYNNLPCILFLCTSNVFIDTPIIPIKIYITRVYVSSLHFIHLYDVTFQRCLIYYTKKKKKKKKKGRRKGKKEREKERRRRRRREKPSALNKFMFLLTATSLIHPFKKL